jgi:2-polyprenyl-3-methyl-5-hydroxy-6-metoxy-1,4-benzoquinol methylase
MSKASKPDFSVPKKIWEKNWHNNASAPSSLARELARPDSIAWNRIISGLKSRFGSLSDLRVIEIGAGTGRAAAKLAREGADTTLVDFSPAAISKAKSFFESAGLRADFLVSDIFALPERLRNSFDISISFGLVEHFKEKDRQKIFAIHGEFLKKGGMAVIGTPNTCGIPYLFWMALARLIGAWEVGYERPYTAGEIKSIMRELGYKYRRWGTPFSETINTYAVNKLNVGLTNLILFKSLRAGDKREKVYRFIPALKDRWSLLDDWLGYHIIFLYK